MRFFGIETLEGKVYVVAEAIGELNNDTDTFTNPSDELSGDVRSLEELLATSVGRRALRRWRSGDDGQYEAALRRWIEQGRIEDDEHLAMLDAMTPAQKDEFFRGELSRSGMNAEEIERWLDNTRPGPTLSVVD